MNGLNWEMVLVSMKERPGGNYAATYLHMDSGSYYMAFFDVNEYLTRRRITVPFVELGADFYDLSPEEAQRLGDSVKIEYMEIDGALAGADKIH